MDRQELLAAFLSTLDDASVTRSERKVVRELVAEASLTDDQRLALQHDLVDGVVERLRNPHDRELVLALGQALSLLRPSCVPRAHSKVYFGPQDPMVETLKALVDAARRTLDIAVFTLTDDRLCEAILAAHSRGVKVRILSDGHKAHDRGSDAFDLARAGIAVVLDQSPHHFHHKFAIVDDRILVTGSYNWTRGADRNNRENFMITEEPAQVAAYAQGFDQLWEELLAIHG